MSDRGDELDVAIVGGGVAGVYAAWRILKDGRGTPLWTEAGGKPRVAIFEYSDRIGGRLLSMELPGITHRKVELGGMRYLTSHSRVVALKELFGLSTHPLAVVDDSKTNLYYLRGQHFTAADWRRPAFDPPYRLDRGERGARPVSSSSRSASNTGTRWISCATSVSGTSSSTNTASKPTS